MAGHDATRTVGSLPNTTASSPFVPLALTWVTWSLFAASLPPLVVTVLGGGGWEIPGALAVDGLTVLLWTVVSFFSGIVQSYSRRYMAGNARQTRFSASVFAFTLVVSGLVAADHLALFGVLWLAMGLLMAELVGTIRGWDQARAAAALARRYFLASSAALAVALATLWWETGSTTVSGIVAAADSLGGAPWLLAASALVLAAMIQSALLPFHGWLLSSMTAPTPASALMHAGFVNAGGILLTRFAPVVTVDPRFMFAIVLVGAASAIGGKLLKSVLTDVKGRLGGSTVGQMGFMIMQVGLGFFGAAIAHLILHGFYKAYQFLGSGEAVQRTSPDATTHAIDPSARLVGVGVGLLTGLAGGAVFAALTGKGTKVDTGLLLTFFVVFTTYHAARDAARHASLPASVRFAAVPIVFFPAIAVYAGVYRAVSELLAIDPAPTAVTVPHGLVVLGFATAYLAIETGVHERSRRLYVALLNAGQPSSDAVLTATEEYNEY